MNLIKGIVLGLAMTVATGAIAQDDQECKVNLSLFSNFVTQAESLEKQGNKDQAKQTYLDALAPFEKVYAQCPAMHKGIYVNGAKLLSGLIELESDETKKDQYVVKLMKLYDDRIVHFGEEGKVLQYKAVDFMKMNKSDYQQGYELTKKAVTMNGNESNASLLMYYAKAVMVMEGKGEKTCEDVLSAYADIDAILTANKGGRGYAQAEENILKLFGKCLECEILTDMFTKDFDAKSGDVTWLKKSKAFMEIKGCLKVEDPEENKKANDIYLKINEKLHEVEPGFDSALGLGKYYVGKDNAKADEYIKQALSLATTDDQKVSVHNTLAGMYFEKGQLQSARAEARKALSIKKNALSYQWIGEAYAAAQPGCTDLRLGGGEVYWIAVDYLMKAKSIAESEQEKTHIQKRINQISGYFLKSDDDKVFTYGVKNGETVEVGCWIGETTTVRLR